MSEGSERWVTEEVLSLDALLQETEDPACGALAVFGGAVRNYNDGRSVSGMRYEAHTAMAARVLREVEEEMLARFDIARARIIHRVGSLKLGEMSVYVVVRAGHRGPAFDAGRWGIDELKRRVPVWKEEFYVEGDSEFVPGVPLKQPPIGDESSFADNNTTKES